MYMSPLRWASAKAPTISQQDPFDLFEPTKPAKETTHAAVTLSSRPSAIPTDQPNTSDVIPKCMCVRKRMTARHVVHALATDRKAAQRAADTAACERRSKCK